MKKQKGTTLIELLGTGLILVLCVVVMYGIAVIPNWYQCKQRTDMMQLARSWGPVQGCMVKVGNRYAPIEFIRITADGTITIQGGE